MKPLLRLFKILFSIYAVCLFAVYVIIVSFCYLFIFLVFPKDKAYPIAHKYISRPWAWATLVGFGIRLKVKNRNYIDPKRTYVFVSNHRSQLDIPSFACANKNTFRFLAKEELTKIPLFGYLIGKLYITVKRGDRQDRIKSLQVMVNNLKQGISVFIYPEGTRNRTDQPLLNFYDGAFRLAIEAQMPLAVMTVIDSKKLLSPVGSFNLTPGVLHCEWSGVIETTGMTQHDVPALKEKSRELMLNTLKRYE